MKVTCSSANNVMVPSSPTFFGSTDSLENNLKKMIKLCLNKISAIEDKAKVNSDTCPGLHNPLIRKTYVKDDSYKVIAYPDSDMEEILSIMKAMRLDSVPVAKHPWNKQFIGVIKKDEIEKAIKYSLN